MCVHFSRALYTEWIDCEVERNRMGSIVYSLCARIHTSVVLGRMKLSLCCIEWAYNKRMDRVLLHTKLTTSRRRNPVLVWVRQLCVHVTEYSVIKRDTKPRYGDGIFQMETPHAIFFSTNSKQANIWWCYFVIKHSHAFNFYLCFSSCSFYWFWLNNQHICRLEIIELKKKKSEKFGIIFAFKVISSSSTNLISQKILNSFHFIQENKIFAICFCVKTNLIGTALNLCKVHVFAWSLSLRMSSILKLNYSFVIEMEHQSKWKSATERKSRKIVNVRSQDHARR